MIIFFLPNGIGDTLMALPAIRRLIALRGLDQVTVVVSSKLHKRILQQFIGNGVVTIERYDGKRFPHLRLFLKMFRMRATIVAPMLSRKWKHSLFFLLLGKRVLVPASFLHRSVVNLRRASISLESFDGHQVNFFVQFLSEFAPQLDCRPVDCQELGLVKAATASTRTRPGVKRVAVGINCGPLESHKIPSPALFARLLNALAHKIDIELLVVGNSDDRPQIDALFSTLDMGILVELAIGLPIEDVIVRMGECDLGLSGTTGQGHMMAAAALPMLVLAGVTNPRESGPYVQRAAILRHRFVCGPCYQESYRVGCGRIACMETLDVEEGVALALKLLTEPEFGVDWLNDAKKRPPVAVKTINEIHVMPIEFWTTRLEKEIE